MRKKATAELFLGLGTLTEYKADIADRLANAQILTMKYVGLCEPFELVLFSK